MSCSSHPIYSLTYVSEQASALDEMQLIELVGKSEHKNKKLEITGYLCYFGNSFVQYLEGDESCVKELMTQIGIDQRHRVIKVVEVGTTASRRFPNWSMRLISTAGLCEIQIEHILKETIRGLSQRALEDGRIKPILVGIIEKIASKQSHLDCVGRYSCCLATYDNLLVHPSSLPEADPTSATDKESPKGNT